MTQRFTDIREIISDIRLFSRRERWIDDLQVHILFNIIYNIRKVGNDDERLCAMGPHLQLEWFPCPVGIKLETSRSVG